MYNENNGMNMEENNGTENNGNGMTNQNQQQNSQPVDNSSYQWSTQQNAENNIYQQSNWNNMNQQAPKAPKEKKPRKNTGFGKKMARCTAYALTFGLVGGALFQGSSYVTGNLLGTSTSTSNKVATTTIAATTTAASSDITTVTDVSTVVSEVLPSIVAITNLSQEQVQTWFGQTQTYESESAGSGIIIKQDDDYLYIVTNNHVVEGSENLTVQFNNETTASAEIQGTDSDNDLAVIKIAIKDIDEDTLSAIKVATLGDSDSMAVGESAIAIGNALGYGQSVTTGVISALERGVTFQDETTGSTSTNYLIQTDAAINPGNSGGALINMKGEVIGINSSKYSDTSVEGMGFAIPANTASDIIEQLIENGTVTNSGKAYLGIVGVDVTDEVASSYKMPTGVYITQVQDDSAASSAGLNQGVIITGIDDTTVASMSELKAEIDKHEPGDKVTLTIQSTQNSEYVESTVEVTLGEYTEDTTTTSNSGSQSQDGSTTIPGGESQDGQSVNPFGGR